MSGNPKEIPPVLGFNMRLIKILATGEIRKVSNNDAHNLIDMGIAALVKQMSAQTYEPQHTELGPSSAKKNVLRQRGEYLIK